MEYFGLLFVVGLIIWLVGGLRKATRRQQPTSVAPKASIPSAVVAVQISPTSQPANEVPTGAENCWIPAGQVVTIAGITVPGGMLYVGSGLKSISGLTVEPAVVKLLPPELSLRERALQAQIVQSAHKRDPQGSTQVIWDRIKVNLAKTGTTASDLDLFSSKTVAPSSYARYCAAAIAIYGEIVRLPPGEAGQMLREMFADG